MRFAAFGIFCGVACLLLFTIWGNMLPHMRSGGLYESLRKAFGLHALALVAIVGYVIWDRQAVIDRTCDDLRATMDFENRGKSFDSTADFDTSMKILAGLPHLKAATEICKAASK